MQYNYQIWRNARNEQVVNETREQAQNAGKFPPSDVPHASSLKMVQSIVGGIDR
jgi:hypothetical protein